MARPNKLGNSYLGLSLEQEEEKKIKKYLKNKDQTAKQFLRFLIRQYIKNEKL